ncbi:hypothetical protein [Micromonospora sp. NPDC004704]
MRPVPRTASRSRRAALAALIGGAVTVYAGATVLAVDATLTHRDRGTVRRTA